MQPYDLSVLPDKEAGVFLAIRYCTVYIPKIVSLGIYPLDRWEKDPKDKDLEVSESIEFNSAILSRAVVRAFRSPRLKAIDGQYVDGSLHSWVRAPSGLIIDVKPVLSTSGAIPVPIPLLPLDRSNRAEIERVVRQRSAIETMYREFCVHESRARIGTRYDHPSYQHAIERVARILSKFKRRYREKIDRLTALHSTDRIERGSPIERKLLSAS